MFDLKYTIILSPAVLQNVNNAAHEISVNCYFYRYDDGINVDFGTRYDHRRI